ncbi:hypothetical protein MMC25_004116, partial [Agyrium rufum]|nr:hypothetical protein [Agyrium rufum]
MSWILPFLYTIVLWFLWTAGKLLRGYSRLKPLGLPIFVQIYDPNPGLLLIRVFSNRLLNAALRNLRRLLGISDTPLPLKPRDLPGNDLPAAYFRLCPSSVELIINDTELASNVLSRRNDFIKLVEIAGKLDIYGPSVQTAEGDTWRRHRKITAPSFNERVSSSVWTETVEQAETMVQSWIRHGQAGTYDTAADINRLTIQVFSFAGLGIKYTVTNDARSLKPGHSISYGEALSTVLDSLILLVLLPARFFTLALLPNRFRKVGTASAEFLNYMRETLEHERSKSEDRADASRVTSAGNFAAALIRASEGESVDNQGHRSQGLTDSEIFGNLFIYNVAGHATTANAITYAIALLAAYPKWQNWIAKEMDGLDVEDPLAYEDTFPKMKRCLAVMLETLRLYPPGIAIPKTTGASPQTILIGNRTYVIPRRTYVTVDTMSLHTNTDHWGLDAHVWRPNRWLVGGEPQHAVESQAHVVSPSNCKVQKDTETLLEPRKGVYVPWSDGPRVCPGRRFSQVEFVAAMAVLFQRGRRVQPKLSVGE